MQTNQKMLVTIGEHRQEIEHLTMMGHLNSLWNYGNVLREKKGLPLARLDTWLAYRNTCEFIISLQKQEDAKTSVTRDLKRFEIIGDLHGRHIIKGGDLTVIETKRGKSGGTWAHLYVLLNAMMFLGGEDAKIKVFNAILDMNNILNQLNDFEISEEIVESVPNQLYVYAIRETNTGNIKLGISSNPENRVAQLQTGNSSQLELVAYKPAKSFKDEKVLHREMKKYHIRGEWFTQHANLGDK